VNRTLTETFRIGRDYFNQSYHGHNIIIQPFSPDVVTANKHYRQIQCKYILCYFYLLSETYPVTLVIQIPEMIFQ